MQEYYRTYSDDHLTFPSSILFNLLSPDNPKHYDLSSYVDGFYTAHPFWLLLGICEDFLPLTFDLKQTELKPILIVSDNRTGKLKLLQSIAFLAIKMHAVQPTINIISRNFINWNNVFSGIDFNVNILPWESPQVEELFLSMVSSFEFNRKNDIYMLTLLDGIGRIKSLNLRVQNLLYRIIQTSATNNNLCIASIDTEALLDAEGWLELFDTTILGLISSLSIANQKLKIPVVYRKHPQKGEFFIWDGMKWLKFRSLF